MRNTFCRRRQCREERERKMAHSVSKLRTVRSVPRVNRVERFQLRDASPFHDAHQIQASIGDSPGAIGEADQRQHRTRRPDFGITRPRRFQRRKRKNDVADRARPNQQATTGDKIACPTPING